MTDALSLLVFFAELFAMGFLVLCLFATAVVLYFSLLAWLEDRGVEHGWVRW